jgi:hypothetical protein
MRSKPTWLGNPKLLNYGSQGMPLPFFTYAYLTCLERDRSVILAWRRLLQGSGDMSWQALAGLFLAIAMVIGGAVGIGLPLALVIIWLCS